jgi:hypothetical protein
MHNPLFVMGNFGLGIRTFFRILRDDRFARQIIALESGDLAPRGEAPLAERPAPPSPAPESAPRRASTRRSDAISLLALLQREARLVDFVNERIDAYSDAQIGAAARDVHKGCAAVFQRAFALQPLAEGAEGSSVEVPRGFDPSRFRVVGAVTGEPPYRGTVQHPGWKATQCVLPEWTGNESTALVVAPVEVEVR